jgi:hypothetical protein
MRNHNVVEVTSGAPEGNLWSKTHDPPKKPADLETDSVFSSAWQAVENIFHRRNNQRCPDFKERRNMPIS